MLPPEAYLIPPFLRPHFLFTTPSPDIPQFAPVADYNYPARQAPFNPAPLPASHFTMPPSKHVRWDASIPRTPSPALSSSSRSSSSGPYTPPEHTHSLPQVAGHHYGQYLAPMPHTPYPKSQPLPPSPAAGSSPSSSPLPLVVSDLLSSSLHMHVQTRPFQWDLLTDPVRLATPSDPPVMEYLLQPTQLAMPATTPPVVELKIIHPALPWGINVTASRYYGNICVTVGDVLQQLYQALRFSVTPSEFNMMQQNKPHDAAAVSNAFEHRAQRAARYGGDERRKGIRRVDFLMDRTQFAGFDVVIRQDGVLLLQLNVR
ncbi:hypothetical protein PsYK624_149540 [Phanerochaete sordida]|uniref:DUF6699 domain-containing protein n=1 Tax=Phanerochaete sordida TaxID=48140 RepID=A0A9P3GSP9_9APHY|nr:hypothetical protein PsYK624_149540 [Phanerochaete sordida]